jgi:hypothetical protein
MKLNIKAILIGWITDLAGSFVTSILIGIVISVSLISGGTRPEQIAERMTNSPLMSIGLLLGLMMSTVGGWVAANVARRDEVAHGVATGLLSIVMYWLLTRSLSGGTSPAWYDLAATLLTIPCAALGGYLSSRKRSREIGPAQGDSPLPPIPEP